MYPNGTSDPDNMMIYPLLVNNEYIFGRINDRDLKDSDIKQIVGIALDGVQGVLGLKGGLTDVFKRGDDLTRGISVSVSEDNRVSVGARLITDITVDPAVIFTDATSRVTAALEDEAGLCPERLNLEISESMLEEEFCDKYGRNCPQN